MDGNKSCCGNKAAPRLLRRDALNIYYRMLYKTIYLRGIYKVINNIILSISLSFYTLLRRWLTALNNRNTIAVEAVKRCWSCVYLKAFKEVKVFKNILTSQKSHDQV